MLNIVRKLTQVNALSRSTSSIGNLVDILSASHRNAQTRPHTHTHTYTPYYLHWRIFYSIYTYQIKTLHYKSSKHCQKQNKKVWQFTCPGLAWDSSESWWRFVSRTFATIVWASRTFHFQKLYRKFTWVLITVHVQNHRNVCLRLENVSFPGPLKHLPKLWQDSAHGGRANAGKWPI